MARAAVLSPGLRKRICKRLSAAASRLVKERRSAGPAIILTGQKLRDEHGAMVRHRKPITARDAAAVLYFLGFRFGCAFGLARTTMTPGMSILLWSAGGGLTSGLAPRSGLKKWRTGCGRPLRAPRTVACFGPRHAGYWIDLRRPHSEVRRGLSFDPPRLSQSFEAGSYRVQLSFCAFRWPDTSRKGCWGRPW